MSKEMIVIGDKVLIAPANEADKTSSGLYLPQGVEKKEVVQGGIVVKTGPGYLLNILPEEDEWCSTQEPRFIPLQVKEGDYALFLRKDAIEIEYDGKDYLILPQSSVLTVVRDPLLSQM